MAFRKKETVAGQAASVTTMVIAELAGAAPAKLKDISAAAKEGSWDSSFLMDEVREKELGLVFETES